MHIILGAITALATLAWAIRTLQNSGFSLDSINPFAWHRRHQWRKLYGKNPLYTLENTMDVAAALLVGTARLDGEVSREQKQTILKLFTEEFLLNDEQAQDLFSSSAFLLNNEHDIANNVRHIVEKTKQEFTAQQAQQLIIWMKQIAQLDTPITQNQEKLINALSGLLNKV